MKTATTGIFNNSGFGKAFHANEVPLPGPIIKGQHTLLPVIIVGDDIFGLKEWLMKPYPGKRLPD